MEFELHFRKELKRLKFKRYHVCTLLNCTMPTLKNRIENPGKFTVDEITKLIDYGFNLKRLI